MKCYFNKIICIKDILHMIHFCPLILLVITSYSFAIDGILDPTFNGTGTLLITFEFVPVTCNSLAIQANGKIIGAGTINDDSPDRNAVVVRLNLNGTLDTTFNGTGIAINHFGSADFLQGVKIQADQKIVAAGFSGASILVARYNTDGSLDTTFGTGGFVLTGSADVGTSLVIQPDGKIVVTGRTSNVVVLVRYNTDGSLDTTFGIGGIVTTPVGTFAIARDVILQPDGKIVICGFTSIAGTDEFLLARYNTDGSLDTTFGTGGIVTTNLTTDAIALSLVLQNDDKIIVGGFDDNNFVLARYNTDGSLDTTFGINGIVLTSVNTVNTPGAIALQTDQKILFAGSSGANSGSLAYTLMRYNTDGTLDTTFGVAQTGIVTTNIENPDIARTITIQADEKIVLAGSSAGGGSNRWSFARYAGSKIAPTFTIEWGNLDVGLNSNIELVDTAITFTGQCSLDGRNHLLTLKDNSQIIVGQDSSLLLENITIAVEQDGALLGVDDTSTFLFDNVTLLLNSNLSFPFGKFSVIRDFEVMGENLEFSYQTSAISTIEPNGRMILGSGLTFTYDPQSPQRDLLQLADRTSQLILNGATLHSTETGCQITRGELFIDQKSFISSDALIPANGVMFGDGIDADKNLKVTIAPAATLEVSKGFLVFADV